MGIINVTPDSFSGDGLARPGLARDDVVASALDQAHRFVEAGARILDIGAESTRPASVYGERPAVDPETEAALAVPVIAALAGEFGRNALISVDSSHGPVARAAVEAGAGMVNDVWGARRDPGTAKAAAEAGAYLVVMHNQESPVYPDGLLEGVIAALHESVDIAVGLGVPRDRLLVDPGFGFAKTTAQSLELLHRLREVKDALGLPMVIGTSRKRFIGEVLGDAPLDERVEGTAATVTLAIAGGADVVRVHDVAAIARTVRMADAIVRFHPR
jgi:dihydropteroate synthase